MFRQRSLVWPFLLLPFLWLAASADRYVWLDSPNPTNDHFSSWDTAATNIMQAINAATNGETIWVTNGVYVLTNQIEVTTSITLRSVNGPNFTLLDGKFEPPPSFPEEGEEEEEEFSYRCLLVSHAEAVVEGFTLTNGYAGEDERGGGLLLANGLVRNCLITGNAAAAGAGVYIANGMLLDSIISGNTVSNFTNALGGGIYQAGGVVANCSIIGNENMDTSSDFDAHNYRGLGGGLMLTNGVARNCLIALNKSRGNGVGVYISGGQLIDCVIQDNRDISQGAFGGGIYQDGGVVTNCIISGNQTLYGGGLYSYSGQFYNGLITKNWAARGGGVYVESTNVTAIYSSTIVSNSASTGGGIYMGAPNGVVWNSIIYHNIATRVADEHSRDLYGWSNSYNYCCADYQDFNPELNNITDDPRLVDWQEGDYRLAYNSPCINTGTNQAWMEAAQDLEGNARRIGPRVDRGAYEYVFLRAEPAAFTLSVMSNQVTNATFNLTNAGADTLYWSIIVTNDWIDLAPTNGELAAWESLEIGFTNDAQDLPAAEYFSRLLISATNTSEQQYDNTLTMTFNVMEFAADIDSLEQNVVQGLDGAPQTFHLWNAGGGELAYTMTTDAPWLSVSPVGGVLTGQTAAATEVTVSFHTSSLKVGTYSGQIIISSAVADEALVLAVTCSVHADAGAQLGVSPGALALTVFQGQPMDERRLTIWNVTNAAGLSLDYEVTADQDWVSVYGGAQGPLASGEEHELLIHFDTSAFQMGVSNATITVTATSSGEPVMGAPVHIPVSINIRNMQMMVSPTKLEHTVLQWHNAATQHFELWNSYGSNAISYSISDDVSWLMVTPASGINTGQHDILTVSYSTMALDVGISNATIQVVSEDLSGAWHSTNLITVQLQILPRAALGCDAVDLLVTNRQGQISVAHNFKVWNDGLWPRGGLKWNAQADVPWLRLNPDMGRSAGEPQTINLAINASGLSPGRYRGSIVISAEDERDHQTAIRSPQIIYVEQVVTGTQSLDFFGDGISAALVVYGTQDGLWGFKRLADNRSAIIPFGGSGYQPVPGDYNGDGRTDLAVYRAASAAWYFREMTNDTLYVLYPWGGLGYEAVTGDFDGDGCADYALYSEALGLWYILKSSDGSVLSAVFGGPGYQALSGDFDGDGRTDAALYHRESGNWYIVNIDGKSLVWDGMFGGAEFTPVVGDFDGDGCMDLAAYHEATGLWFAINIQGKIILWWVSWGAPGCQPVSGDFNGDGITDLTVYHEASGTWYMSSVDGTIFLWGLPWGGPNYHPLSQ